MTALEKAIFDRVNSTSSISAVNLVLDVMREIGPGVFDHAIYMEAVDKLVLEKEIYELDFIDPQYPDRLKSIYFKKGTIFPTTHPEGLRIARTQVDSASNSDARIPRNEG